MTRRVITLNWGRMTKCNFCFDEIDQGKPPACVAACPLRVLDFIEVEANQEEVNPPPKIRRFWAAKLPDSGVEEVPLVIFTLCGQMAAGMAFFPAFLEIFNVQPADDCFPDRPGRIGLVFAFGKPRKCLAGA
jgi:hypothetical protein